MIIKILEYNYKGFHLVLDEDNGGWKCIIGEKEIRFPHSQAAETAIDEILKDSAAAIKTNKGVVIGKVKRTQVTKTVEEDSHIKEGLSMDITKKDVEMLFNHQKGTKLAKKEIAMIFDVMSRDAAGLEYEALTQAIEYLLPKTRSE